jgi:hypothetical protein
MPKLTTKQRQENADRRARADKIIAAYTKKHGDPHDPHSSLTDLIADIMHSHGHRKGLDVARDEFDDIVRVARTHFEAERRGEP